MKLTTEVTLELPRREKYFDYFSLELEAGGLRIKARSAPFAAWVKTQVKNGPPLPYPEPWGDGKTKEFYELAYSLSSERCGLLYYGCIDRADWFSPDVGSILKPNLTWLLHKDLETGMDLLVKQPISLNDWEDYFNRCCSTIEEIWAQHLRTGKLTAKFYEELDGGEDA